MEIPYKVTDSPQDCRVLKLKLVQKQDWLVRRSIGNLNERRKDCNPKDYVSQRPHVG